MKLNAIAKSVVAIGLLAGSVAAHAAVTTYNNQTAWQSAVGSVVTDDFESYGWTSSTGNPLTQPANLGGNTYAGPVQLFGISSNLTYDAAYLASNYIEWQSGGNLTITFNQAVNAIGFDFGQFYGDSGSPFGISLSNGFTTTAYTNANSYAFWGVNSDTSFTSVTLSGSPYPVIDNLSVAQPVPEPETYALMGLGALALLAKRRKSQKAA